MAVVWRREAAGHVYEVRCAGRSRRLYRDGVLHTQYNPSRALTRGVWDLLLLPAFGLPRRPRRVLVLGVGGGAVLRLYPRFLAPVELCGVDIDPLHLQLAQEYFGVDPTTARLYEANAWDWLHAPPDPEGFDIVIDDVFGGEQGEPHRIFEANRYWFDLLSSRLSPGGILVMNFPSMSGLSKSAWMRDRELQHRFPNAYALRMPHYGNAVGVFGATHYDGAGLRKNAAGNPEIARELGSGRLRYSVQALRAKQ